MCLIVLAHGVSDHFPLVVAANRDEDHARPSMPAHVWEGGQVAGGRDLLLGGAWLAVTRSGRFAAVTNLRGAVRPAAGRSRGELVTDFVTGDATPREYANEVARRAASYGGFHLLVGEAGGSLVQVSGTVIDLERGIHGLSNAPAGVVWPKVTAAMESLRVATETATAHDLEEQLLRLLRSAPSGSDPTRDLFVRGERYGTRASTVIVATHDRIRLVEQSFGPGGAVLGPPVMLELEVKTTG